MNGNTWREDTKLSVLGYSLRPGDPIPVAAKRRSGPGRVNEHALSAVVTLSTSNCQVFFVPAEDPTFALLMHSESPVLRMTHNVRRNRVFVSGSRVQTPAAAVLAGAELLVTRGSQDFLVAYAALLDALKQGRDRADLLSMLLTASDELMYSLEQNETHLDSAAWWMFSEPADQPEFDEPNKMDLSPVLQSSDLLMRHAGGEALRDIDPINRHLSEVYIEPDSVEEAGLDVGVPEFLRLSDVLGGALVRARTTWLGALLLIGQTMPPEILFSHNSANPDKSDGAAEGYSEGLDSGLKKSGSEGLRLFRSHLLRAVVGLYEPLPNDRRDPGADPAALVGSVPDVFYCDGCAGLRSISITAAEHVRRLPASVSFASWLLLPPGERITPAHMQSGAHLRQRALREALVYFDELLTERDVGAEARARERWSWLAKYRDIGSSADKARAEAQTDISEAQDADAEARRLNKAIISMRALLAQAIYRSGILYEPHPPTWPQLGDDFYIAVEKANMELIIKTRFEMSSHVVSHLFSVAALHPGETAPYSFDSARKAVADLEMAGLLRKGIKSPICADCLRSRSPSPGLTRATTAPNTSDKGLALEERAVRLLQRLGWQVSTTPLSSDGGIDVRAHRTDETGVRILLIGQCKNWEDPVGVAVVRELIGVSSGISGAHALLIAPRGLTKAAEAFAAERGMLIWDERRLLELEESVGAP